MASKTYDLTFDGYYREKNIGGLPAGSGIYCVYAGTYSTTKNTVALRKLVYIGESGTVYDRVANHEKWPAWRRQLAYGEEIVLSATTISPEADRQRAEAALIHHHKPPCNTEYVDSFPFDTTTITTAGANILLDKYFTVYRTAEKRAS